MQNYDGVLEELDGAPGDDPVPRSFPVLPPEVVAADAGHELLAGVHHHLVDVHHGDELQKRKKLYHVGSVATIVFFFLENVKRQKNHTLAK